MLKFSVITPSFNQGRFIEDNIKSVLAQDYPNFEHIIIDGSSTDNTINILKKYLHLKWVSEADRGQAHALNKCLKKVTGDIICWLNSDDLLCSNCFYIVNEFFKRNKNTDMVYGNCIIVDDKRYRKYMVKPGNFSLEKLLYRIYCYIPQSSTFFKVKLIDEIGYFDEKLEYTMDYDYWIRIGLRKNVKYINEELSMFRLHKESKTVSKASCLFKETLAVSRKYGGNKFSKYYYYYCKYGLSFVFPKFYTILRAIKHELYN